MILNETFDAVVQQKVVHQTKNAILGSFKSRSGIQYQTNFTKVTRMDVLDTYGLNVWAYSFDRTSYEGTDNDPDALSIINTIMSGMYGLINKTRPDVVVVFTDDHNLARMFTAVQRRIQPPADMYTQFNSRQGVWVYHRDAVPGRLVGEIAASVVRTL